MTARGLAGWAAAVSLGIAAAVVPAPQSVEVAPARVEAAGYGTAAVEPRVRVPAVADLERRTATAPTERGPFDRIADCETGGWLNGGASFVEGSARWDAQGGRYSGGLQWLGSSWLAWRAPDDPPSAHLASRVQQIAAAERYRAWEQSQGRGGYGPWPACARLLGLPR